MKPLVINSERIILQSGLFSGYLTSKHGVITEISSQRPTLDAVYLDAGISYVSPGFIDLHTHGGGGFDYLDGDADCIIGGATAHLPFGTTTLLPTTLATTGEELLGFLENYNKAKASLKGGPYLHGIHLEGPYFSYEQRGAQDPKYLKSPEQQEYESFVKYAKGAIVRWSIAPELPGALEMGDYLYSNGILPSAAHTDAEYTQLRDAFDHHYTLLTHFYSGMSTIKRRSGFRIPGVIESGYIIEDIDVEIIADGCHLPPELLRMIYRIKGYNRIALVTDSMRAAGVKDPEGTFILGSKENGQPVIVEEGVAKLPDKTAFAGSVATTDRLVRVMHKDAGVPLPDAVKMVTATPARIIGIGRRKGTIAVGMDCDLVVFDDDINVKAVFSGGALRHGGL